MLSLGANASVRGSGHLILNVLRAFNIIGLVAVAVASWVMIVMTGMKGHFFFFDAAAHFFTSTIAIFLVFSEVNLFKEYFSKNWPVLTPGHGLGWLGFALVIMGCHILGNLNEDATSIENIGLAVWRLILASGILAITFGVFNIISAIIFRDSKSGITSRMIRSDGSLASGKQFDTASSRRSDFSREDSFQEEKLAERRWTKRFTAFGGKRPKISKPIPQDLESTAGTEWPGNDRQSPIMPEIKRPNTALHPMNTGVSRYSEASHLPRF